MTLNVAHCINRYPQVGHSFIRREIQALDRHSIDTEAAKLAEHFRFAVAS